MQGPWTKLFSAHFFFYAGVLIVLVYLIFSLNNSFDKMNLLSSIKSNLETKKEKSSQEIEKIKEEIENIKNDPSHYLKVAREEFFYTKPDEYLYVVVSKDRVNAQALEEKKRDANGVCERVKK